MLPGSDQPMGKRGDCDESWRLAGCQIGIVSAWDVLLNIILRVVLRNIVFVFYIR